MSILKFKKMPYLLKRLYSSTKYLKDILFKTPNVKAADFIKLYIFKHIQVPWVRLRWDLGYRTRYSQGQQ